MAIQYLPNGNLVPGEHEMNWDDFVGLYGFNTHRKHLISGLKIAINILKKHGCKEIYIDGSFTNIKNPAPNDYDGCWNPDKVDLGKLIADCPCFIDIRPPRKGQKALFRGELFPSTTPVSPGARETMLDFFKKDRDGNPKGIVKIPLKTVAI